MENGAHRVSVVLCTYNGEKYLSEQMESIVNQTYPIYEIVVQDDGSTDKTLAILKEYAERYPAVKIFKNTDHRFGLNSNFFSAMRKATGDLIAISDQDDIWELDKLACQVAAIGDSMLCTHKSKPFSTEGLRLNYDDRTPNYHIVRLLFASIPGHTMLFKRELLDKIPPPNANCYGTAYDVIMQSVAASFGKIKLVDKVLVHHRRLAASVSYQTPDSHTKHSYFNALYMLWWSATHYRKTVGRMRDKVLIPRLELFQNIQSDSPDHDEALAISELRTRTDIASLLKYSAKCIKHRNHLFFTETRGVANFVRAALYPIMQIYSYKEV